MQITHLLFKPYQGGGYPVFTPGEGVKEHAILSNGFFELTLWQRCCYETRVLLLLLMVMAVVIGRR